MPLAYAPSAPEVAGKTTVNNIVTITVGPRAKRLRAMKNRALCLPYLYTRTPYDNNKKIIRGIIHPNVIEVLCRWRRRENLDGDDDAFAAFTREGANLNVLTNESHARQRCKCTNTYTHERAAASTKRPFLRFPAECVCVLCVYNIYPSASRTQTTDRVPFVGPALNAPLESLSSSCTPPTL